MCICELTLGTYQWEEIGAPGTDTHMRVHISIRNWGFILVNIVFIIEEKIQAAELILHKKP